MAEQQPLNRPVDVPFTTPNPLPNYSVGAVSLVVKGWKSVTNKSRINTFGDLMCPHSVICLVGPHKLGSRGQTTNECQS